MATPKAVWNKDYLDLKRASKKKGISDIEKAAVDAILARHTTEGGGPGMTRAAARRMLMSRLEQDKAVAGKRAGVSTTTGKMVGLKGGFKPKAAKGPQGRRYRKPT